MNPKVLQQLTSNAALLLVLSLLYIQIVRRWQNKILIGQILKGCLFGVVSIGVMMSPFHLLPGLVFDTRSVVISVGGFFGGPIVAVISVLIANAFRVFLGGVGALTGVLVVFCSAGIGVFFYYYRKQRKVKNRALQFYLFGVLVHLVMLLCMLSLPWPVAQKALKNISIPVMLIYPLATVFLCFLISDNESKVKAEQLFRESQERYRRIVDTANEGVWEVDQSLTTIFANRKLARLLGYEPDELIGKNLYDFILPEDLDNFENSMLMRRQGKSGSFERRYLRKDGQSVWVQVNASPFLDDKGNFDGAVGMVTDITERKQQEEALRMSEERYREIIEGTKNLVTEVDRKGRLTFVNEASRYVFGLSPQECIGRLAFDFIHPDDREETMAQFGGWLKHKKKHVTFENRQISQSGKVKDMLWSINFRFDENGYMASAKSIARDITERKLAEKALKKSESFLSATISSIQDGVSVLDHGLTIIKANPIMEQWYAHMMPLQGKKCHICYRSATEPFKPCPSLRALKSGQKESDVVPGPEGSPVEWIELFSYPIHDPESGAITGVVEFLRDITEQKKAEEELRHHREHLEELVQERTSELQKANAQLKKEINERRRVEEELREYAQTQKVLVREVNHRVKNNLTAIISMLHMKEDSQEVKGHNGFQHVLSELEGRINGLLTIHSLLSASGWRPLKVTELCRQVVNAASKGIPTDKQVKVKITPSEIKINSNQAHHLTMIINELTTNTIKYALKERREAAIEIAIEQQEQNLRLVFKDDGPGYPDHIFRQTSEVDSVGFELIKGITTKSLGGNITFANNGGAQASITFVNKP